MNKIKSRDNIKYDLSRNKSIYNTYSGEANLLEKASPFIQSGMTTLQSATSNAQIEGSKVENPAVVDNINNSDDLINNWNQIQFGKTNHTANEYTKSAQEQFGNILSSGLTTALSTGNLPLALGSIAISGLGSIIGNRRAKQQAEQDNLINKRNNINAINKMNLLNSNIASNNIRNMEQNLLSLGGNLFNRGANYDSGLMLINEGGSHESNPNEGIQLGTDEQGNPNLVEQGEVVYKDYVFSNRLHLTEEELKKNFLPTSLKNATFAYAAEQIGKNLIETPTDNLERNKVESFLQRLANIQEAQRAKMGKQGTQQMAYGGNKYSGEDELFDNLDELKIVALKKPLTKLTELGKQAFDTAYKQSLNTGLVGESPIISNRLKRAKEASVSGMNTMYAPIIANTALGVASMFQKPDYTNAELLEREARNIPNNTISPTYLNDYLTYRPLDRNYYLNQLKGQAGATRSAIMNSGSNAGNIMANLLAADYNAQNAVANSLMQMDQYNNQQRQAVSEFNRGTNQYNAQSAMQANQANAQLALERSKLQNTLLSQAAQYREGADTALMQARTKAIQDIGTQLGQLGKQNSDINLFRELSPLINQGYDRILNLLLNPKEK